jgi:hypothetical protein
VSGRNVCTNLNLNFGWLKGQGGMRAELKFRVNIVGRIGESIFGSC